MAGAAVPSAALDVFHPSGERTRIPIDPVPFRIGRGPDNHLILRDNRASRAHARVFKEDGAFAIEDLDSTHGTWVNGDRIRKATPLRSGDTVHFGFEDSYRLVFADSDARINRILDQLSSASSEPVGAAGSFARLRALVEVARTLQTSLAADEVLGAVIDAALVLTGADRGFLLLRSDEQLEIKVGRDSGGAMLTNSDLQLPAALINEALADRHDMLSMSFAPDTGPAGESRSQPLEFPNVICVPLVQFRSINSEQTVSLSSRANTVGVLYLDSRTRQNVLSELNRELLHTLALEASTVLEHTKLLEQERQKQLLDQELEFARKVQRSLLPQKFPETGWFRAAGSSLASAEVAGDYFDVHPIGNDAWASVIADVSGKGVSSALLAALLQGAFLLGSELEAPLDTLLSKINHFLIDRSQREKYATLIYARIERSGAFVWANAGHCLPFLVRASGEVRLLDTTGAPIGLLEDPKFEVDHLQLLPGDKIVAYSDGLAEIENGEKQLFERRLATALEVLAPLDARQIHDKLVEQADQFGQRKALRDDVTLLVLEYRGEHV